MKPIPWGPIIDPTVKGSPTLGLYTLLIVKYFYWKLRYKQVERHRVNRGDILSQLGSDLLVLTIYPIVHMLILFFRPGKTRVVAVGVVEEVTNRYGEVSRGGSWSLHEGMDVLKRLYERSGVCRLRGWTVEVDRCRLTWSHMWRMMGLDSIRMWTLWECKSISALTSLT